MMKRLFDFVCSLIGLIIFSPVLLVLSIMVVTGSSGGGFSRPPCRTPWKRV